VIVFESVTKRYADGTVAVDDLDLEIPQGKITVLVGPSGCGKTTTLRMINRMIDPSSGRILVDGKDNSQVDLAKLRLGIGYVIQSAGLFPHRTVLDNVATVPYLLGWDRKKARARGLELLERVGLPAAFADRYPVQLSGGQQQRVGVARALAADPPLLLMDEPFSAVDPIVRASLQEEFLRLQSELGKTIAFVTHDIDEAIKLGDLVAVFRVGGHLAQLAAPEELLAAPADEFVRDFVGRDRGIRGLSFITASGLAIQEEPTVAVGEEVEQAHLVARAGTVRVLVVDGGGKPVGWVDPAARRGVVAEGGLEPLGGVLEPDGSMRRALDLALVSPAGRAVAVDASGVLRGTVTHDAIAEHLAERALDGQSRYQSRPSEAVS